jgi:hypothetical protein
MAGLLDTPATPQTGGGLLNFIFNDPGSRAGLAMMAASSPRYGRGLMQAMQAQDQMRQQDMQNQLLQSQIEENKSQAIERQQALAQAQQKQAMLSNLFGGGQGGNALAGVTTGGGVNVPQTGGGIGGLSIDQVAALKANGIDVADLWKTAQQGLKQDAGSYYKMPDGSTVYMPQLDKGMAVSGGGVVPAPGYAQANALIKGTEAGAVEAAKYPYAVGQDAARQNLSARLDPTKVYNPQTGREELIPRAAVVQPQYSGAGYSGGSAAAAAPEQLLYMQAELDKLPQNHPDRPALMREMQRLGGGQGQSGNYAAGPSAAEAAAQEAARVRAVDTAKADVARDTGRKAEVKLSGKLNTGIDRAIELLGQEPTSSVAGNLADKGLGVFGMSTKGGEKAAQLEALSGWLVSNVPRMEGPQSNIDVQNYQTMAGRIGDRNLPIGVRKAAAEEVRKLQEKYSELNGAQPEAPARPKEFPTLPNAAQYDGKRMRAPDGTIYRSTGGKWTRE